MNVLFVIFFLQLLQCELVSVIVNQLTQRYFTLSEHGRTADSQLLVLLGYCPTAEEGIEGGVPVDLPFSR